MTNTANTPKPNDCPTIRRKIGKTTYIVRVHFSENAKETMEDKIKRIREERGEAPEKVLETYHNLTDSEKKEILRQI